MPRPLLFRSGPSTGYSIIKTLYRNTVVYVTHHNGLWRRLSLAGGTNGYVHGNYIEKRQYNPNFDPNNPINNDSGDPINPLVCGWTSPDKYIANYTVTANVTTQMHNQPDARCPHDGTRMITKGDTARVVAKQGEWLYVFDNNAQLWGWIHENIIRQSTDSGTTDTTPPAVCGWTSPSSDQYISNYTVTAHTSTKMHYQPDDRCPHDGSRWLSKGNTAKVIAKQGEWLYMINNNTQLWGWAHQDATTTNNNDTSNDSGNRIVNTIKELGCIVFSTLTALPPSSFKELGISTISNVACGSVVSGARDVQRTCLVEAGITSGCPWVNQEPYRSNVEAWLARPDTRNGNSQAIDESVLSAEAAYVNCLWAAANFGPDHWSLGWNHGGCVSETRTMP